MLYSTLKRIHRWAVKGLVEDILTVIYTVREDDDVYHIISAKKATKKEGG